MLGSETKPCNPDVLVRYNFAEIALASVSVYFTCFVYLVIV